VGSIQAGYRIDEKASFGGSLIIYAHSEYLSNGQIASTHIWRMLGGEMVVDAQGNISLNSKTCSGTTVRGTYTATTSNVAAHQTSTLSRSILDRTIKCGKQVMTK
jgi:hypothetical protein